MTENKDELIEVEGDGRWDCHTTACMLGIRDSWRFKRFSVSWSDNFRFPGSVLFRY